MKNREMNMCEGPIFKKIIIYSLPLMATNVLQLLFNVADVAVLGAFVGDDAVAAVGGTSSLINLITGLFIGLSVGANVIVARSVGRNDIELARRSVGTSVLISVIIGCFLAVIGFFGSRTFLVMMKCDPDVIDMSVKYLKIYFIGMPIMMLYNFCASILRAVGDTLRPLIYLIIGGVTNIILNIFFVVALHKDVEGVAIATITSQGISAFLAIIALAKNKDFCRLETKHLRLYFGELSAIARIGIPAGLQGCVFSLSNVVIQSTVNSFGKTVMAGNTVASQLEGITYNAMNAIAIAALSFISQNVGAKNLRRVKRVIIDALVIMTITSAIFIIPTMVFDRQLCGLISNDSTVIDIACKRLSIIVSTYTLCGVMDVCTNSIRGLGKSTLAMIIALSMSCLFRIVWINTFFRLNPTLDMLYYVYPMSWILTIVVCIAFFPYTIKSLKKKISSGAI